MDNRPDRDELSALRAEYDDKLAAIQAELTTLRRHSARRRRRRSLGFLPLALLVALVPFSVLAVNPFTDLTGGVHDANIDAIYNAGITKGCVPNQEYCPEDNVTRQEMASFLARAAGLGDNPPVANAKTAQTATNATNATNAQTAGAANTSAKLAPNPITGTTYAANELVRVARAVGVNKRDDNELTVTKIAPDTAYDPIVTVTITAPGAGFVIVTGTVGIGIEGANTVAFARLRDTVNNPTPPPPVLYTASDSPSQATTLSPVYVFPVAASVRSFILEVQKGGAGDVHAFDGVISAIFVPFGSGGTAGTLEGQP
jgi:hypothetical protein